LAVRPATQAFVPDWVRRLENAVENDAFSGNNSRHLISYSSRRVFSRALPVLVSSGDALQSLRDLNEEPHKQRHGRAYQENDQRE